MKQAPLLSTLICLVVGFSPINATPITLLDLCEPYREVSFTDGVKSTRMTQYPVVDESRRIVVWSHEKASQSKQNVDGQILWRTREGSSIGYDLKVKNQFFALYLNSPARLLQRAHIRSEEEARKIIEALSVSAKAEFDKQYQSRFIRFAQHTGYPIENLKDIDEHSVFERIEEGKRIEFAGRHFEAGAGEMLALISPSKDSPLKNLVPILVRVQGGDSDFVFQKHDNFETSTVYRCDFMTEEGLALEARQAIETDANGIKSYEPVVERALPYSIGGRAKVGTPSLMNRVQAVFLHPDDQSDIAVLEYGGGLAPGELVMTINGSPAKDLADLKRLLDLPPEKLGEAFKVVVMTSDSAGKYIAARQNWRRKEIEVKPDLKEIQRQRELIAEHARIKEEARQSVITLHEEERARIRKEVIEFRKQAELEVLKTKEGIIDLVRQRVQPALLAFTKELAEDDPLWAISYLKYLAHAQPDALTVKQREKLYGVVWMAQDTRLDSSAHFDLNVPGASKLALEKGVSLTPLNTKPSKVSVAEGEMVFNDGDSYLLLDHPAVLLEFILDDEKDQLTIFDTFLISDCGICNPNEFYYFERENLREFEQLSFIREKDSLTGYQEIVTASRDYESYEIPQPKRRTLTGLLFKGWVFATVSANVMLLGAEAVGMDTDELLNEAQKGALEPKPSTQIKVTKMISQWDKMSTWTGNKKGRVETHKLSNGSSVQIYEINKGNDSFSSRVPGWYVSGQTALKYSLRTQKSFSTREAVIAYIESVM